MLSIIIQYSVLSIVMILLLHYLYNFFKDTLTIPKVKDLIHHPSKQYEKLFESIQKGDYEPNSSSSSLHTATENNKEDMKNELKNYLNEFNNKNNGNSSSGEFNNNQHNTTTTYTSLDSLPSYSSF